ncbi:MAG: 3-methyl-2-oxobutanoate hydroxymethyltransferase [Lentisphaerae bacterium]|nr:3-methyl-2-oxobutanoate hydroxymethyltransferase [Lentisphaerota bacterium]
MEKRKLTVASFRKMKNNQEKIVMVTAYDAPGAAIAAAAGVEMLLVGDSLAMTALGYENTLPLTLDESLHHAAAVRRGAPDAFVVGDMPFLSYQLDMNEAVRNAGRYIKEARCDAVKLEGGMEIVPLVEKLVLTGIPVIAHVGLMPQHIQTAGGYRVAGKTEDEAARLLAEVKAFEKAGAFAVVLECIPAAVAGKITQEVSIPTIGIGAGSATDGQVQVCNDLLGLFDRFVPKHAKRYCNLREIMLKAYSDYVCEVKNQQFPTQDNSF